MSKVYSLKAVQLINTDIDTAWKFFSNAGNLNSITPKKLGFKIIGDQFSNKMYAGQIIQYKVKPLLGIPLYWMTEITHVKEKEYFVDEQRFGPYAMWHHQHHFKQINNAVEMTDLVHYKIPFWFIGDIANVVIVKKQLEEIFAYRHKIINEKYNGNNSSKPVLQFG